MNYKELLEKCIFETPLALLAIKDQETINKVNSYLPYTTGFEIECSKADIFTLDDFKTIPDIVFVDIDSSEQRFQIPAGIRGLVCLYHISEQLKINSTLNNDSGIHYHVDMKESYHLINSLVREKNKGWILEELSTWKYKGTYNRKSVSTEAVWCRVPSHHKTMEIRIGEMTFDYKLLVTRIIHCNSIVQRLNESLNIPTIITTEKLDTNKILDYIKSGNSSKFRAKLNTINEKINILLQQEKENMFTKENMSNVIINRIFKLNNYEK